MGSRTRRRPDRQLRTEQPNEILNIEILPPTIPQMTCAPRQQQKQHIDEPVNNSEEPQELNQRTVELLLELVRQNNSIFQVNGEVRIMFNTTRVPRERR